MTNKLRTIHIPTSNAAPYALNDCVGGIQSIVGTAFDSGNTILSRITVQDRDKEAKALDIHFFSEGPLTSSIIDNQQYNMSFADLKREIALVQIQASDFKTHVSGATASAAVEIPIVNVSNQGMMFMAVESKSPNLTYSSAQSLAIQLIFK